MRTNPLFESFNTGELSPWLLTRTGYDKYKSGLETCANLIALIEGPLERRPGTRFVAEAYDSAKASKLVRFQFSTQQAYIIEFAHLKVRFFRHQSIITSEGVPVELTSIYAEEDLEGLSFTQSADVLYIFSKKYAPQKLVRTAHDSWAFEPFETNDGPYLDTNSTSITLTPSGITGSVTITASGATFVPTDINRLIRINNLSLIHISEPTDRTRSRMPSSA